MRVSPKATRATLEVARIIDGVAPMPCCQDVSMAGRRSPLTAIRAPHPSGWEFPRSRASMWDVPRFPMSGDQA
jgi:hypothetical protein